jgi:hypothetical protein
MQRRRDATGKAWLLKKVAPEGTTLYVGTHFEVFVPSGPPPEPSPSPTPNPSLTPRMHLPLVMGGCGYLIGGRIVPPVMGRTTLPLLTAGASPCAGAAAAR